MSIPVFLLIYIKNINGYTFFYRRWCLTIQYLLYLCNGYKRADIDSIPDR